MKIGIIKKDFNDAGGGAERYAREICRELLLRGHEICVFSETFNSEDLNRISHVKVPKNIFSGFSSTMRFHRNVQKVLKSYRKSFDLTYALSRTYPSDVYRVTESLHCEWFKIHYSFIEHLNPRHIELAMLEKKIMSEENTKLIVCNSELVRNQVVANFAYPAENIFVVRNGIDFKEFYPVRDENERCEIRKKLNLPDDKFILLFIATNFVIKGFENLLRGLSLLPKKELDNIQLIAVGGEPGKFFKKMASDLKLDKNIIFLVKIKSLRDYYVVADLLVHPAFYEPYGNVCAEALACGLPVLTTNMNGSSELIEQESNGYIIPASKNQDQIAEKVLTHFKKSNESQTKMRKNASNSVKNLSWSSHVDTLVEIFRKLKNN